MRYLSRSVIFTLVVILSVMIAGCASTSENGLPSVPSPAETGITPAPTTASQADLTNQNSPFAAVFRNGASYTPLAGDRIRIGLEKIIGDLSSPMMIAAPFDGSGRKFVVDKIGLVRIITPDGKLTDEPFLDLRDRMVRLSMEYDERGLFSRNYLQKTIDF